MSVELISVLIAALAGGSGLAGMILAEAAACDRTWHGWISVGSSHGTLNSTLLCTTISSTTFCNWPDFTTSSKASTRSLTLMTSSTAFI